MTLSMVGFSDRHMSALSDIKLSNSGFGGDHVKVVSSFTGPKLEQKLSSFEQADFEAVQEETDSAFSSSQSESSDDEKDGKKKKGTSAKGKGKK